MKANLSNEQLSRKAGGTFLQGESVLLRGLTVDDLNGPYVSWLNDPDVCQFNSHHNFPYSPEQAASYIEATRGNRSVLVLAVVLKETGDHIGNISLQGIDPVSNSAEFAILMGEKKEWGKGFAKEAAFLLVRHGFLQLNLHRVHCGTHDENVGMQKLAEYLGMQLEGRAREAQYKNGKYSDQLHYGVLKREFLEKFKLGVKTDGAN